MAAVDPWQLQADPEWAVAIVIAAVDYAVVVRTFGRRGSPTPMWRRCCFAAGLALIAIGLLSPLEHIALTSLLSAHLLQNVILADWAPPLLVLGLTPAMMAAAEKRAWVRAVTAPPVALALWLAAWYVAARPRRLRLRARAPLGARPRAPGVPRLRPRVLVGGDLARPDARALAHALPLRRVHRGGARLVRARVHASRPYDFYEHAPKLWGLSPLEDQQIGAVGMAIEQAVILFAACSIAFMQWLDEDEAPRRPVGFPT